MLIHHALYGSKHGGHALLASSDESLTATFRAAAWATDLPSTVPNGISWKPYFRTVCIDKNYILIYTSPDETAQRGGMVTSRAAFLPLEKLHEVIDLRPIAQNLISWNETENLQPFVIDSRSTHSASTVLSRLTCSIANHVCGNGKLPAVVIGQDEFDTAMFEVWSAAPPELRPTILFSLSFGPDDTVDRRVVAVCTPKEMTTRWTGYDIVSGDDEPVTDLGATMLNVGVGRSVRALAYDIGLSLASLDDLNFAHRAYLLWKSAETTQEHIDFIRLLAAKSEAIPADSELKIDAVRRAASQFESWTVADVLSMRNLNLSSFSSAGELWGRVERWASTLDSHTRISHTEVGRLLADAIRENAVPEWCDRVIAGVQEAFAITPNPSSSLVRALWHALSISPAHTANLLSLFSATPTLSVFTRQGPDKLEANTAEHIAKGAAEKGQWDVAGVAMSGCKDLTWATKRLLQLRPPIDRVEGALVSLLARADPSNVIQVALATDHPVLVDLAGAQVASCPSLLTNFDWRSPVWFEILVAALQRNNDVLQSLPGYPAQLINMIECEAQAQDTRIWNAISKTSLGNLLQLSNRARAWRVIPSAPRAQVLEQTVNAWLANFLASESHVARPEVELIEAIQAKANEPGQLLRIALRSPTSFVTYMDEIFSGSDDRARDIVEEIGRHLPQNHFDSTAAAKLGEVILQHGWARTASKTASLVATRRDFLPVAQACQSILNLLERFALFLQFGSQMSISDDEAWEVFESEATALYPAGPSDQEVWSRSSGKNADLANEANGRAQWHRCLKDVRRGKGPTANRLIHTMLEDFPRNPTLLKLEQHRF
jgi:hypothetical protein